MRMQDIFGTGLGGADIPYDQTQPAPEDILAGAQAAGGQGGQAAPPMDMGMEDPTQMNAAPTMGGDVDPMSMAGDMGAGVDEMAPDTDMLSDEELAMADSPEAPSMEDIMSDPNLTPEDQAALQQAILMAARRQAAGI